MSTQRSSTTVTATTSCYDDMPLSQILFRYLWPFWLFRDASHGDLLSRAAAYRHNRSMRIYLPGYLVKWSFCSALLLALTLGLDSFSAIAPGPNDYFVCLAAGSGMAFACALCVSLLITYVYFYLSRNDF